MVSFELDLLRYKRGAVATLGIILTFALSFFVLEWVLGLVEANSSASLVEMVGFRAIFYLLFAIIGIGCVIFTAPLLFLTYRLINFKSKHRLEITNGTDVEFLSPLEFTKVKFSVENTSDIRFIEKDDRYTVEFIMQTGGYMKRAVTGESKHQIYVTQSTFTDLKAMFQGEEILESAVAEIAVTKIDSISV